jgi:hypothetical protein
MHHLLNSEAFYLNIYTQNSFRHLDVFIYRLFRKIIIISHIIFIFHRNIDAVN